MNPDTKVVLALHSLPAERSFSYYRSPIDLKSEEIRSRFIVPPVKTLKIEGKLDTGSQKQIENMLLTRGWQMALQDHDDTEILIDATAVALYALKRLT